MSFFRIENEELQEAPNFVHAPGYRLLVEDRDSYTYPTEGGWVWFDTSEEAKACFGVVVEPAIQ